MPGSFITKHTHGAEKPLQPVAMANVSGRALDRPPGAIIRLQMDLTSDGTSTGSRDMISGSAGYSVATPGIFYMQAPIGVERQITQIVWTIADTGLRADRYGNITALTNGIRLVLRLGSIIVLDLLDGQTIQKNIDLYSIGSNPDYKNYGAGYDTLVVGFDLKQLLCGQGVLVRDQVPDNIAILIRDPLIGIDIHRVTLTGYDVVI